MDKIVDEPGMLGLGSTEQPAVKVEERHLGFVLRSGRRDNESILDLLQLGSAEEERMLDLDEQLIWSHYGTPGLRQ